MMDQLPALQVMLPLVMAPVVVLVRHPLWSWVIATVVSFAACLVSWLLLQQVMDGSVIRYAIGGWEAPTGIEFYIDRANAGVALLVSGLSSVVLVYAYHSIKRSVDTSRHYLFYSGWLLCLTGLIGMVITGDAFNVFVFLEISSLSTYMLIAFGSDRRALVASFRYLVLGSVGASFILIGIGFLYAATGTLNMVDLAARIPATESPRAVLVAFSFLTVGLMIKAAVFPLHGWLLNAYHHAPIAVTAFLAGTATKVSLYILVRMFFSIFGDDYSFSQMLLNWVLLPAAIAAFLAMSLVAIYQTDLRRMLAYSSVAQIGYILAGISLATQQGLTAAVVHMFNHGMVKATLFMAVGCILYRVGHTHIPSLDRLMSRMPFSTVAFIVAGLGLIGVPLTVGFVSKFTLVSALLDDGWWPAAAMILVSSVMATAYIGRVVYLMLFREARSSSVTNEGFREVPVLMLAPMYFLLALGLYFGVFGSETLGIAAGAAEALLGGYQ